MVRLSICHSMTLFTRIGWSVCYSCNNNSEAKAFINYVCTLCTVDLSVKDTLDEVFFFVVFYVSQREEHNLNQFKNSTCNDIKIGSNPCQGHLISLMHRLFKGQLSKR